MKKLFIYYSDTGSGDLVAEKMKEKGFEIRKVFTKRPLSKIFFFKVFFGGFAASRKKKRKLKDYDNDVKAFDEVIIGSPIWAGGFSCPINTVLASTDLSGKKLSFILWSGSGTGDAALERIKIEYANAPAVILKEPNKYPEELQKLQ